MINDKRIVLTLDAGGTNFRFSAIQSGKIITNPVNIEAKAESLDQIFDKIISGFQALIDQLPLAPSAISFAFPGPANYEEGIIGDLENLPLFKGGVALGPFLKNHFKLPVFINNDGDLFALGEAIGGFLPTINMELEKAGNPKRYRNLIGLTFGTGFGAGIVSNGALFIGDNSAQAEINRMRNHLLPATSIEDSVSIRAIKRVYAQEAKLRIDQTPEPFDIYKIAKGEVEGNKNAALKAFETLGIAAGNSAADAITLLDGMLVIGGGLSGAYDLIIPHMVKEMNKSFQSISGNSLERMEVKAYNLQDASDKAQFLKAELKHIRIPRSEQSIAYDSSKKIGVSVSLLDTSEAVAIGAYAFAIQKLGQAE
ncbi:MAG: ROK family protein [Bacteroidales bacterium]|nr:ROK family protein [Bacteroidales bacterium]